MILISNNLLLLYILFALLFIWTHSEPPLFACLMTMKNLYHALLMSCIGVRIFALQSFQYKYNWIERVKVCKMWWPTSKMKNISNINVFVLFFFLYYECSTCYPTDDRVIIVIFKQPHKSDLHQPKLLLHLLLLLFSISLGYFLSPFHKFKISIDHEHVNEDFKKKKKNRYKFLVMQFQLSTLFWLSFSELRWS